MLVLLLDQYPQRMAFNKEFAFGKDKKRQGKLLPCLFTI
ncbi:hypothetical protein RU94_GL000985 [Enterococcus asini]|nr:hypothetical protein RU94_GL000985 [Enterococcus asini]